METPLPPPPPLHRFQHLTYPDLNLVDNTLEDNLPPIGPRLLQVGWTPSTPTAPVGALQVLPPELLHQILYQLDLASLHRFRQVNRQAAELLDSLPQYKSITTHALSALRGIRAIRTGKYITCRALFEKLCTAECEECGDFGGYLYLLTCKRVCFLCFANENRYVPIRPRRVIREYGLDLQTVQALPRMRVLSGTYSLSKKMPSHTCLIDQDSALRAGVARHGSLRAMCSYASRILLQKLKASNGSPDIIRQIEANPHFVKRRRGMVPFDEWLGNPARFVAIVRAPCLMRGPQGYADWGFHCIACKDLHHQPLHFRRKFSVVAFDHHLRECGEIQNGRHKYEHHFVGSLRPSP
jgi:hypothetical protein